MKLIKQIALSAMVTIGIFGTVIYTSSCTKDKCKDVNCNTGTCSDGTCTCPTGYNGTDCGSYAIIGHWTGSDICTTAGVAGTSFNVNVTVDSSGTGAATMILTNPSGYGATTSISGTLSTDAKTVTFTNQTVGANTISGTITMTSNAAFTFNYTTTDGVTLETCAGNYTRQ